MHDYYKSDNSKCEQNNEHEHSNNERPVWIDIFRLRHNTNASQWCGSGHLDISICIWTLLIWSYYSNNGILCAILRILKHIDTGILENVRKGINHSSFLNGWL